MTHTEALKMALEALEIVTKEMLALRDELAERGARPTTNVFHQRLWDLSFKAYTEHALPTANAIKEALAQPHKKEPTTPKSIDCPFCGSEFVPGWLHDIHFDKAEPVTKRPQNCGTGYCSCIECVMEPAQSQQDQAYKQANPLGGPAKVFDAMADAIRAGDDYSTVLRQYGFVEAQPQKEPDLSGLKPESQKQMREWLADGSFAERAIGALQDQERRLMAFEKVQPQQEPVAWLTEERYAEMHTSKWTPKIQQVFSKDGILESQTIQYAPQSKPVPYPPPQRTWVGLTDEEIDQGLLRTPYAMKTAEAWREGVRWAYHQLKEKNT